VTEPRALITGIRGFCGTHLAIHLRRQGFVLAGIELPPSGSQATLQDWAHRVGSDLTVYHGDIRDLVFLRETIRVVRPTQIFHLAALISSDDELERLYDVNVRGTQQLLSAIRAEGIDPVILITGSSAAYGVVGVQDLPIRESQPFRPLNLYAVSKIAQEMLAYSHHARYGLRVVRTRAFNVTGPGEPPSLAPSAFARQIAEIELGRSAPVLRTGNLSPQRDFVDVRDLARAYRLLAQYGKPGEVYNVCSGQAVLILTCLQELVKLAKVPIRVEPDPARTRATDLPVSVGDPSLVRQETGWQAEIPLAQSLADLLDDWRRRMGG
jgi:GDP-4-dehydro-6-deoxy-D-mannose reductase